MGRLLGVRELEARCERVWTTDFDEAAHHATTREEMTSRFSPVAETGSSRRLSSTTQRFAVPRVLSSSAGGHETLMKHVFRA